MLFRIAHTSNYIILLDTVNAGKWITVLLRWEGVDPVEDMHAHMYVQLLYCTVLYMFQSVNEYIIEYVHMYLYNL